MLPILAALTSGTCFAIMQLMMKRHTTQTSHPFLTPAFFGLLTPFWLLMLAGNGTLHSLTFNLTPMGLLYPALWAAVTVTSTCILVWLFRTFSLTELTGYRKALITLGALVSDVLIFAIAFPLPELVAIALLLTGALLLSRSRSRLPSLAEFAILVGWCSVMTIQITFYKEGQHHQSSVLANTILMQLTSSAIYASMWLLPQVRRQAAKLPWQAIAVMLACNIAGTLLEGFAYAGLPLAALMVLTILPSTLFAAHDLWHGHLPRHPRSYVALAILALGLILLMFTK
jgi:drug/metabolite transporter (DMT)-like permease